MHPCSLLLLLCLGLGGYLQLTSAGTPHVCTFTYYKRRLRYVSYNIYCWNCYRTRLYVCGQGRKCQYYNQPLIGRRCCEGWTGPNCDIPICNNPGPCRNKGVCVEPDKCSCPRGFGGTTCNLRVCSYLVDCFPGYCENRRCTCSGVFEGSNCLMLRLGANFTTCNARLLVGSDQLDRAQCFSTDEPPVQKFYYTNKRDFNQVQLEWSARYPRITDIPQFPTYLQSLLDGVITTRGVMILRNTNGGTSQVSPMNCTHYASRENPAETINCDPKVTFREGVTHGQELEFQVYATTGGRKKVRDERNLANTFTRNLTGIETNRSVIFRFDLNPPFHCNQTGECDANLINPIIHGPDLLPAANFTVDFAGWSDTDSGLQTVYVEIYHLSWHNEGYLVEDLDPVLTGHYDLFSDKSQLAFDLPRSGMYSIIARVMDWANNTAYARALLLYDDESGVEATGKDMNISGSAISDGDYWITTIAHPIEISPTGRYENKFQVDNHLLDRVRPFSARFPENDDVVAIDDVIGNRTTEEFLNENGIAKFSYFMTSGLNRENVEGTRKRRSVDPPQEDDWVVLTPPFDSIEQNPNRGDGDAFTLWVRPEDAVGHTLVDYVNIRVDSTPPVVRPQDSEFVPNTGHPNGSQYYSRLDVFTHDSHSGIHTIEFELYDVTRISQGTKESIVTSIHQGKLSDKPQDTCVGEDSCVCTKFDECYESPQPVYINNCWLRDHMNREIRFESQVYNRARLSTELNHEIGKVSGLTGMDQYPGIDEFKVQRRWGFGVILSYYFNESCYSVEKVLFELSGASSQKLTTFRQSADRQELKIEDLLPGRDYTATAVVHYEGLLTSEPVVLHFNAGPGPEPTGPGTGAIVGIVIGVLLFILIIVIVVLILIRVRAKKHPIPQNVRMRATTIRNNIVSRFSRHPAAATQNWNGLNVEVNRAYSNKYEEKPLSSANLAYAYVSRPLHGDEEDIYYYGGMETDPNANWSHSKDKFSIGKKITSGKFADIYLGILEEKNGRQTVAAKMLKSRHSPDDQLLMKAKMNFMAHGIDPHPNMVNFMGAVVSGPIILLEYCDESLKDWLKKHQRGTDEDDDNMINFTTDIARGMEHLHEVGITHRRLGARNVLLKTINGRTLAKLIGFGPMKGEEDGGDGLDSAKERVPIKWMAPEQLGLSKGTKREYNEKTDVWSFGVVVWEIFSKGDNPYSDKKSSAIKEALDSGYRLSRPPACPDVLFEEVVDHCWATDPSSRPDFTSARSSLENLFHNAELGEEYYSDRTLPQFAYITRHKQGESQLIYDDTAQNKV